MLIDCLSPESYSLTTCALISRMPEAGELVPTENIKLALGGCASNAGLDLANRGQGGRLRVRRRRCVRRIHRPNPKIR